MVEASTSSTKKKEEEELKAKIETFNAETAAVLAAFKVKSSHILWLNISTYLLLPSFGYKLQND